MSEKSNLEEALHHPFLETIRANHNNLHEDYGGCALWNNKEWIEKIKSEQKVEI